MVNTEAGAAQQIVRAVAAFVCQRTSHAPALVTVAQSPDALMITLHHVRASAHEGPARPPVEQLQQTYQELLAESSVWLHQQINRITGFKVLAVASVVEAALGTVAVLISAGGPSGVGANAKVRPDLRGERTSRHRTADRASGAGV